MWKGAVSPRGGPARFNGETEYPRHPQCSPGRPHKPGAIVIRAPSILTLLQEGVCYHLAPIDRANDNKQGAAHNNQPERPRHLVSFVI